MSIVRIAVVLFALLPLPVFAQEAIGVVVMHGKGGSPTGLVAGLARALEGKGYLVANLDMPWSGSRHYDVPVSRAEEEVAAALAGLRAKGAKKVFVAGHSQGGAFVAYLAGKPVADGFIAIAPGGDVGNRLFREHLGESVARARKLVAEGKGNEPAEFLDYESSRGTNPVHSTPAVYLTWFEPEGAMNLDRTARRVNPDVPMLWIVPERDYPGLRKTTLPLFGALPRHPRTRLYEPNADHRGAPTASADEIARWTQEVAGAPGR